MNNFSAVVPATHPHGVHLKNLANAIGIPESKLKVALKYQSLRKDQLIKIHNYLNTVKEEKSVNNKIPRVSIFARKDLTLGFMSSKMFF